MVLVRVAVCDAHAFCDQELDSVPGAVEETGFHHLSAVVFSKANFRCFYEMMKKYIRISDKYIFSSF